jgi:uncharacterized protein YeeX (DUF496 family)
MATIEKHSEMQLGFRIRLTVKITQKNRRDLEWFKGRFKIGSISKDRKTYDWKIRKESHVIELLQSILPYIKSKKQQAEIALQIANHSVISEKDLLDVARLADSLSKFNVRSKNRRQNYASMIEESISRND